MLRHTDVNDGCRGRVVGGRCNLCNEITPGILNWCFEMTIHDIDDPAAEICIPCYKGCGASMFKVTPSEFEEMSPTKQADVKESWCGVPIIAGVLMQLDNNGDKAKLFLYNVKRLPEQYLAEEDIKK